MNQIVLGGGRNLDIAGEATASFGHNSLISKAQNQFLQHHFQLNASTEVESRWSGLMAFTPNHMPIIEQIAENQWAAMGCNGMGVAMGCYVGKRAADQVASSFRKKATKKA